MQPWLSAGLAAMTPGVSCCDSPQRNEDGGPGQVERSPAGKISLGQKDLSHVLRFFVSSEGLNTTLGRGTQMKETQEIKES